MKFLRPIVKALRMLFLHRMHSFDVQFEDLCTRDVSDLSKQQRANLNAETSSECLHVLHGPNRIVETLELREKRALRAARRAMAFRL